MGSENVIGIRPIGVISDNTQNAPVPGFERYIAKRDGLKLGEVELFL